MWGCGACLWCTSASTATNPIAPHCVLNNTPITEKQAKEEEEANRFEHTFDAVVEEIKTHPEVWIGCKKELSHVVERLRAIGAPPMRLIHGETIARLRRIPKSDEIGEDEKPYWISLEEMINLPKRNGLEPIVSFASHRWVGGVPDKDHSKARAIMKFTNYHRAVYRRDSYWWVDYTCMDQSDVGPHIAALPLYIAASEEVIAFFSPSSDYRERGWIRCELALSATLNSPRAWRVTPITDDASARAAASEEATEFVTLNDPGRGVCFAPSDLRYTGTLGNLAVELWTLSYERNWNTSIDSTDYRHWPGVQPQLVFGETKIFTWNMNAHMGSL